MRLGSGGEPPSLLKGYAGRRGLLLADDKHYRSMGTRNGAGKHWTTRLVYGPNGTSVVSAVSVEDYVHDALHLVELDRIQSAGHLDMGVAFPLDLDG